MYIVGSYLTYLAVTVAVTVWVGWTLRKNGRVFLVDAFHGNSELADSVNHLLVVGFYLVNIGFVALAMQTNAKLAEPRQAIELVCGKVGWALLVLGVMHFMNLYIFNRLRKRGQRSFGPGTPAWKPDAERIGRVLD